MKILHHLGLLGAIVVVIAVATFSSIGAQHFRKVTLAPHEFHEGDAPPPIVWEPPALPSSINLESAEERRLRVVAIAKGLEQPWSLAFLPDGSMLVTERSGRLRIVREGKLASAPVPGVPVVQTGGPRGLQGLSMPSVRGPWNNSFDWVSESS